MIRGLGQPGPFSFGESRGGGVAPLSDAHGAHGMKELYWKDEAEGCATSLRHVLTQAFMVVVAVPVSLLCGAHSGCGLSRAARLHVGASHSACPR